MNVEQSEKKLQVNRCCGCKKDSSRLYFVYIVILLSCMHAFPRHLSIETEMDVTERRQTEAVVAAAADCGEQTKLQVVVTRRLQPCAKILIIFGDPYFFPIKYHVIITAMFLHNEQHIHIGFSYFH